MRIQCMTFIKKTIVCGVNFVDVSQVSLPDYFAEGFVLSFAPCSNLCLYMLGAACCLQRASNFQSLKEGLTPQVVVKPLVGCHVA